MKLTLFIFTILSTSCTSFFLRGIETYDKMYVTDTTGCRFINVHVVTAKKGGKVFDTETLSFVALTDRDSIRIPLLQFDFDNPPYHGIGTDKVNYTVYYQKNKIQIYSTKGHITLSTTNK